MSKPPSLPKKPLCIYCQAVPAEEGDHTLPSSWYADGTDPRLRRLTVPSCKKCGGELKKAEEQAALMWMLARGFDHKHPAVAGVYERMQKTWDPAKATTEREREHRIKRIRSVMTRVQPVVVPRDQAIGAPVVRARTAAGLVVDASVAIKFRRTDLDTVAGKFVRGLHYDRTGTAMPAATKITAFEPDAATMEKAAELPGGSLSDALLYRYAELEPRDGRAIWFFILWGQVNIGAVVDPPGSRGELGDA